MERKPGAKVITLPIIGDPTKVEPWQQQVGLEALQFAADVETAWGKRLRNAENHLPDKTNTEYRRQLLNAFIDTMVGIACHCIATYSTPSEEMQKLVCKGVEEKFGLIRDNWPELMEKMKAGQKPVKQ